MWFAQMPCVWSAALLWIRFDAGIRTRPAVAGIAEPLKSYVGVVASAWDAQKRSIAEQGRATYVDVFQTDDDAGYTASDSIHPNERGYELWASHIVSAIAAEA